MVFIFPNIPVIRTNPFGFENFRDPKVSCIDGTYYMVVGSGNELSGKVLLYKSVDLLKWDFCSVLFEDPEFAHCIECPDFFRMGDKYVLMLSKINEKERAVWFVVGYFRDGKLVNYTISRPEWGPDFYAPQTFRQAERRIMIGWMYHWGKSAPEGCPFAGALSIPRELTLCDGKIRNYPVAEARGLLTTESQFVRVEDDHLVLLDCAGCETIRTVDFVDTLEILEDAKSIEVFVNGGDSSFSYWLE